MNTGAKREPSSIRIELLRELLDSYRKDYQELCDDWRAIETKAQATVTMAGVFVAAMFAFLNQLTEQTMIVQKILLTMSLLGLVVTVLFSVLAMKVDEVYQAPFGDEIQKLVMDLLNQFERDEDLTHGLPGLQFDQIEGWKTANDSLYKATQKKAFYVFSAQVILVATLIVIGVLAATFVFRDQLTPNVNPFF